LKLDMLLTETGYKPTSNQRLRIYLTNSLEEQHPDTQTLFATWLSDEANGANQIKRDAPVMVVLGNPPYSGESANKGEWIYNLLNDYKKEPGGKEKLNERNPKWINDDYVKFLRYGQHFIEKNGSGILAYINPHGFLDNPTFRGMRWNLLKTYDKIYTIDLHGNSNKKETSPDGSVDVNVFDIQQGVSINIFVKNGKKKTNELGKVFHFDLYGKREYKYDFLLENSIKTVPYKEIQNHAPMYFMVQKDLGVEVEYNLNFSIDELFEINSVGIVTAREDVTISFDKKYLSQIVEDFKTLEIAIIKRKYNLPKDTRDWKISYAKKDLTINKGVYTLIACRPFDIRNTFYTGMTKGFYSYPRNEVMNNFIDKENLGLVVSKQASQGFKHIFITNKICNLNLTGTAGKLGAGYVCPLYLYPQTNKQAELSEYRKNLEFQLEEARVIFESFNKSFNTIKKMYASFPNPDAETKKYYKEQEKLYKKTLGNVEKLEKQISTTSVGEIFESETRTPNLNMEIVNRIAEKLGLRFTNEKETTENTFAPIDILDYIYAVLHSPTYREKYKEFLKIDFPRVPYPQTLSKFRTLTKLGAELRQIHLLESPVVDNFITQYPVDGNNTVTKIKYQDEKVYINDTQYFDNVPEVAWNFYIGGYQPAQKWLKDRKDRKLEFEDILHYQKIIVALTETDRLMKLIDTMDNEYA